MKKLKEHVGIVFTLIAALMLVGMIPGTVKAENVRSGEYEYSLSSGHAVIEKYVGSATDVTIPSTIDGYEVKVIDSEAFKNAGIKNITIPEGVTKIYSRAFENCKSLSTVNFNAVNCEGASSSIFGGCDNLKTVNIGSQVTKIGSYLFSYVPVENIVLPSSVKVIDYNAFANSALKSITIPEGITKIYFRAFENCKSLITVNFNAVNCEGSTSPIFIGCDNLKIINIGSQVTSIGSYLFSYVPAENIVLPTSVKEIDYDAFANSELKSITIPENVQNISFEVFKGCKNFKDIYYGGSKQGWLKIRISDNNKELKNATIHFAKIQVQPSKVLKANKKKKAKKVKIKILKVASSYGYRVQVSTTKNFKKKILDKKVKKCSFTLSNSKLKKKKKLYVRVQNSQLYNGKVLNSSWSKAYKVKIK